MSLWLPRGSGLVEQFTPPELTLEGAVERSWRRRAGGRLLEPKPGEWLTTEPYDPRGRVARWALEFIYGAAPWGPL